MGVDDGVDDLARRFPAASLQHDQAGMTAVAQQVLKAWAGEDPLPPLDLSAGTAFQKQVWDALLHIPRGQTRSYGALARQIGKPTAARAVGQAVGANPVAVLVPCHRVVNANGQTGHYHWGPETKVRLLMAEGAAA
ncbi:MAG: methylated-DNA--[protein]-cysteine S-methyltransferase [Rhodospirillales bacterium]|nr:methylated-DNA--[protein]-cysteine S-methyltransferase [Rhodospirillales bacterium]